MPPGTEHAFGYTIPNLLIDHAMRNPHILPGFWRGVNINQNCIFIECFMDELAQAAGQDRARVPPQADGQASEQPRGAQCGGREDRLGQAGARRACSAGSPQMKAFDSYVAAAAEVSVEGGNKIKIHRIVAATDPTYAVNPAQIDRQVAGSFVYGLSALFYQECTVKDGAIEQTNFDTYNSMRIAEMPKVEIDHHAVRRQRSLGRRRRADHLRGGAGGAQRVLQGDRQAHPLVPAEEPRHRHGVTKPRQYAQRRNPAWPGIRQAMRKQGSTSVMD